MNANNGMTLWRDVFEPITDFRREFDRLFDGGLTPTRGLRTPSTFVPPCEVEEKDDHYLLTLEMAGVRKDDIKIEVTDNRVVISGERQNESRKKEDGYTYSERRFGKFQRTFALPTGAEANQVEANYQDGVLRVLVPKSESAKPRQIKITHGSSGFKFFGKLLGSREKEEPYSSSNANRVAS